MRLPSFRMEAVVLHEVWTSEDDQLHSNAYAELCSKDSYVARMRHYSRELYMASGEAKYASRRFGWVVPSSMRWGRAMLSYFIATYVPLFLSAFPSTFTTTKIIA